MRVTVVTHTTAGRGGIERVVELQAAGLRSRGHEVDVLGGPQFGRGWLARAAAAVGAAFIPASRLQRADVVLAHYPPAPSLALRSGKPYVHYFHHPLRAVHPTAVQQQRLRFQIWSRLCAPLARVDARGVHGAHAVAVPSPSVGAALQRIHGVDPVLLPLGVDTRLFTPGGRSDGALLFVGRLDEPYKHLDWAMAVAGRLRRRLRVVGEGRPPSVPRGVDVEFRGYRSGESLRDEYRTASVLLFPSVHEDFGLVPVEAMACGLPVVGWDDGHGPSVTLAEGSGGLLVPPYEIEAFAATVARLLNDPSLAGYLRERGPQWVAERFSLERHVSRLEDLLVAAVGDSQLARRE